MGERRRLVCRNCGRRVGTVHGFVVVHTPALHAEDCPHHEPVMALDDTEATRHPADDAGPRWTPGDAP